MNEAVIIPAKNESRTIGKVIEGIRDVSRDYHIIVIDDGSEDSTAEIARSLGCEVHRLEKNMGKGHACRLGASKASSQKLVFMDADGQFYPEEIPKLAEKLEECDIAIGARSSEEIPFQRRLSNSFARFMVNSAAKSGYRDVLCGFRAARRESFQKLGLEKDRYEFEAEMLIKASRKGLRVCEVPVKVRYLDYPGMPLGQSLKLAWYIIGQKLFG
ncbi:MAG TPA: glycosyltransferase family 2 protein [archaeon]|nr:glycosyltransferase family 2 protein [archaeon]